MNSGAYNQLPGEAPNYGNTTVAPPSYGYTDNAHTNYGHTNNAPTILQQEQIQCNQIQ